MNSEGQLIHNELSKLFDIDVPILIYNPPGLAQTTFVIEAAKVRALGIIDLDFLSIEEIQKMIVELDRAEVSFGARVDPLSESLMAFAGGELPKGLKVLIFPTKQSLSEPDRKEMYEFVHSMGLKVFQEVCTEEEAKASVSTGVDGIIPRGYEGGGRVSNQSTFVLFQQCIKHANGIPIIPKGGIGPRSAAALFAGGASGIVLDVQLYTLPESPLNDPVKKLIRGMGENDTDVLCLTLGRPYRCFAKVATKVVKDLKKLEAKLRKEGLEKKEQYKTLKKEIVEKAPVGFKSDHPVTELLFIGQEGVFAKWFESKGSLQNALKWLMEQVKELSELGASKDLFSEGGPLAKLHQTKFPFVQGPMANITDSPSFAKKVSKGGALPMLALGNLPRDVVKELLEETKKELKDAPFGCGLIGIEANAEARDAHLELLEEYKPPYALLAGGTTSMVLRLEKAGITTYYHAPSPQILVDGLESGLRGFIFEGMESGGHIGTLSSLVLWEQCLEVLEKRAEKKALPEGVTILFAGGIHDDLSSSMIQVMCSRVSKMGVYCGLHLGTIYLFTKEIIETEALTGIYQKVAIETIETRVTGDTVNVRARSAPTPYVEWLIDREFKRLEEGLPIKERKLLFEADTVGALRISARGVTFNEEHLKDSSKPVFLPVDEKTQYEEGNFLIGQLAALHDSTITIAKTHKLIASCHQRVLEAKEKISSMVNNALAGLEAPLVVSVEAGALKEPLKTVVSREGRDVVVPADYYDGAVAIVGMGAVFPKGIGLDNYWKAILDGVDACIEVPPERWEWRFYYHPDPKKADHSYTKIGAFVRDFKFDPFEFKIPPAVATQIDLFQRYGIVAAKEALKDAGLFEEKIVNKDRMAVIIANVGGGEMRDRGALRMSFNEIISYFQEADVWREIPDDIQEKLLEQAHSNMERVIFEINEDTMAGSLPNIAAGRLANIFGIMGPSYTSDAACASTFAAVMNAMDNLNLGRSDIVVTGGMDSAMSAPAFILFCKIGALTPDGSRPFSKGANGFLMGEGSGTLILKRLDDAVAEKDKIYAVIRGIGASSDGKGKGITAPNPKGQALSIRKALEDAKIDPSTISFIEAHGTSTAVGDVAEFNGLQEIFQGLPENSIGLTSIKSQIGHLKAAAGAAGMIKAALAIYHKVLPPQINFKEPNPYMDWDNSPFYVITEPTPWERKAPNIPRRCGISSFGFGGTNFHIVLEEFDEDIYRAYSEAKATTRESDPITASALGRVSSKAINRKSRVIDKEAISNYMKEKGHLEAEVFCFNGDNPLELLAKAEKAAKKAKAIVDEGGRLRDALEKPSFDGRYRLAIVAKDPEHFIEQIGTLKKVGMDPKKLVALAVKGIFVGDKQRIDRGKTCFMFPGQGSQYLNMLGDLREKYKIVGETLKEADGILHDLIGKPLTSIIYVDVAWNTPEYDEAEKILRRTEYNQPAMLTCDLALFRMLQRLGVKPDVVMGHSLGEYAALVASGILSFKDALYAVSARGKEMKDIKIDDPGKMASISAGVDIVEKILKEIKGYVIAANKNCYLQTVIAGESKAMDDAVKKFKERGIDAFFIPVSHAFHTAVVAPAKKPLRKTLEKLTINPPKLSTLSNVTADYYPMKGTPKEIREKTLDLMEGQVAGAVEWIGEVKKAYEDGCRVFIELGPKRALTSFAYNILEEEVKKGKVFSILSNHPKKGGITTFNELVGSLWVLGYNLNFQELNDKDYYTEEFLQAFDGFSKEVKNPAAETAGYGNERVLVLPGPGADPEFAELLKRLGPSLSRFLEGLTEEALRAIAERTGHPLERIVDDKAIVSLSKEQKLPIEEKATEVAKTAVGKEYLETASPYWSETKDKVLTLVAEKTGYPQDMLGLDLDLEADLGIDTVKQVELFAIARDEFELPRDEIVSLTDFSSLRDIIDFVVEKIHPTSEPVSSEMPAGVSTKETVSPHWTAIKDKVLTLVAEKTGYPQDMLGLDLDLEADLGVDTVKQVELFAIARDEFELPRDEIVNLTDFSTLRDIIDFAAEKTALEEVREAAPVEEEKKLSIKELKGRINRWVLEAAPVEDISEKGFLPLEGKKALIIDGGKEGKKAISGFLGAKVLYAQLDDLLEGAVDLTGIDGVINLYPLSIDNNSSVDRLNTSCKKAVKSLFIVGKKIHDALKRDGFFISVTGMGGKFGLDRNVNPAQGGVAGFTKAVSREYPKSKVMVFDTDPALAISEIEKRLTRELQLEKLPLEVGWDGKNRYKPVLRIREPPQPKVLELKDGMKILVSGGATGITAEIIKELAKKAKINFHIIDILELLSDAKRLASLDKEGLEKEKESIKKRLKKTKAKNTEAVLEKEFTKLQKSIEIQKLIEEIESTGSTVEYHSLDVTKVPGLKKIAKEFGPFNGIIHGAGVERSKLMIEKDTKEFDLVFNVKVKGAQSLLIATKNHPLEFFLSFSSVAGRFGNRGQVDYSAANEALVKFFGTVKKLHPDCIVKVIGWSAWADVGMASRGSVKTILEVGGITFIPVKKGVSIAINELTSGIDREVFYAGSLGPLDKEEMMKWDEGIHPTFGEEILIEKGPAPLIDEIIEKKDDYLLVRRKLDGKRERFLPDHTFMGTMVLPGVMGMELFAEVASLLAPEKKLLALEDVMFNKPVSIKESLEVNVVGKVFQKSADISRINLKISSRSFSKKENKEIEQEHFTGIVVMGQQSDKKEEKIITHPLRAKNVKGQINREEIYKYLFHGETFRVLEAMELFEGRESLGIYHPITEKLFTPSTGISNEEIITSPMQSECGFQTAGIYIAEEFKMMALPTGVGSIHFLDKINVSERAITRVQFKEKKDHTYLFDVDIIDLDGKVRVKYQDLELKAYMSISEKFKREHSIPFEELITPWEGSRVFRIDINSLPKKLERYKRHFTKEEWKELMREEMTEKRKREHLAGRLIAKCALSWVESTEKGLTHPLSSIRIQVDQNGKPFGLINGERKELSISHSHQWAIASVSDKVHGTDLELSETRDPAFLKDAFTKEEIKKLKEKEKLLGITHDMAVTLLFSAKEAILKMVGVGLKEELKKVTLKEIKRASPVGKEKLDFFKVKLSYNAKDVIVYAIILESFVLSTSIKKKK